MESKLELAPETLRGYVDYLRDLGVYDLFCTGEPTGDTTLNAWYAGLQGTKDLPVEKGRAPAAGKVSGAVRAFAPDAAGNVQAVTPPARPSTLLTPFEQEAAKRAQRDAAGSAGFAAQPDARRLGVGTQRAGMPGARPVGAPEIVITPAASVTPRAAGIPSAGLPGGGSRGIGSPVASGAGVGAGRDEWGESGIFSGEMPAPVSFNLLAPLPGVRVSATERPAALTALRTEIGDCTRCPLAYAGRHSIVFADGKPEARLMFVGEGPGADEDASGLPFVGKAGQLLNNMIQAMGLRRDAVYIANIVKCRPPKNRTPEPVEANTCSPFLLRQIDIVQPQVIVALGGTAATYLLGVKQSLASLRGQWFDVRGSKCAVTYHPAFLLRDPRQKGEAWKDLQRVMVELDLKPPARV